MDLKVLWEKYYQKIPLEKIPWQRTQADYFTKIIDSGKIQPGKALDLGCGTGRKSIELTKRGFKVTGIDISPTAIRHARDNAKKEQLEIRFIATDAIDLFVLGDEKFDFVLDWANLHGLSKSKWKKYVQETAEHTKTKGQLLLRCFSKHGVKRKFAVRPMGRIYLFSRKDIEELFGNYFRILETNRSKPFVRKEKEPPGKWLDEYLMERI